MVHTLRWWAPSCCRCCCFFWSRLDERITGATVLSHICGHRTSMHGPARKQSTCWLYFEQIATVCLTQLLISLATVGRSRPACGAAPLNRRFNIQLFLQAQWFVVCIPVNTIMFVNSLYILIGAIAAHAVQSHQNEGEIFKIWQKANIYRPTSKKNISI